MDSCFEYELLMSQQMDEALSASEKALLDAHLETCPDCRMLSRAFGQMQEDLSSLSVPPPHDLHANIMARVKEESGPSRFTAIPAQKKKPYTRWLASAAALVLVVTGAVFGGRLILSPGSSDDASMDHQEELSSIVGQHEEATPYAALEEELLIDAPEDTLEEDFIEPEDLGTEGSVYRASLPPVEPESVNEFLGEGEVLHEPSATPFQTELYLEPSLTDQEAIDLLLSYLTASNEEDTQQNTDTATDGESVSNSVFPIYQGISEDGQYHIFYYTADSGETIRYLVSRSDGSILEDVLPDEADSME